MSGQRSENRILRWRDAAWYKRSLMIRKYDPASEGNEVTEDGGASELFCEKIRSLRISSEQKKGKVTDCGYDAFVCCYATVPADRNVKISADIRITGVPDNPVLNEQEAWGVFLRDNMEKEPETGHYYSNMAAAGMWRGRFVLFGREGITAHTHDRIRNILTGSREQISPHAVLEHRFHLTIIREGDSVCAEIHNESGDTVLSSEDARVKLLPGTFSCRDREKLYVGFMAARGYEIEVIKDTFEMIIGEKAYFPGNPNALEEEVSEDPFMPAADFACDENGAGETEVTWASPDGDSDGDGSSLKPYDLMTAVARCRPGGEIRLIAGNYRPASSVVLGGAEILNGGSGRSISGAASAEDRTVIDFGNTDACLRITGSGWAVRDIDVTRGNGIRIEGHYNRLIGCRSYRNNETGILIRHRDNDSPRAEWPSYNIIEDCVSYENCDPSGQHADGFACKVAAGEGNRFTGCKAYMNSDDGFDLFAKNRKTGAVIIEKCESSRNGYIQDENGIIIPSAGNGNGFKLGGSGEAVEHIVRNSVARKNRGYGFTNNSNPSMILTGCKGVDNEKGDLNYYIYSEKAEINKVITDCDFSDDRKIMIDIRNISKDYRLGQIGHGTLQRDLQSWWARKRGKEDPNIKIGQGQRLSGDILHALSDINLKIYQGERVGIIGSNGAGKSTLLKLISRVAAPTRGSIDLYVRVTSMLEGGTGFHGEMTGRENIYLNGAILGMSRNETESKMEEIIDFSEVRDHIDTPVKRYSSGMYVRLAFSVASHLDSEIVIMDEVLAVGDSAFQKKCIAKMRQSVLDENRTVLYVSHNMNTVRELCDRCIVLAEGRIIFDGEVEEAISCYENYLQSTQDGLPDLLLRERRDRKLTGKCRIAAVRAVTEAMRPGEDLRFELTFMCEEDLKDVRIRLIVCNGPGEIVGMSFSDPADMFRGMNRALFSMPLGCLAPGGYICDIAVFEFRGGVEEKHDFLHKVLPFRITEQTTYFGRTWKVRTWGNVLLESIRTEELTHEQQE